MCNRLRKLQKNKLFKISLLLKNWRFLAIARNDNLLFYLWGSEVGQAQPARL